MSSSDSVWNDARGTLTGGNSVLPSFLQHYRFLFIPVLFAWLLHNPADHRLGREHERGDGSRILQSRTSYLGGVDHAGLHQVFVLFGGGVEAEVRILVPDLLDHDGALPHGLLACAT